MAKGDSSPGLLAKVARFVAHPTKGWAEQEAKEPEPESAYSKESLKEMIERKRQNDFVRRREFDHLRKIRRQEPLPNASRSDRPSFFQSSLPTNPDERAMTLKKIDEIEAQMSHQWWRGKAADGAHGGGVDASKVAPGAADSPSPQGQSSTLLTQAQTQGLVSESRLLSEAVTLPRQSQATELVPHTTGQGDFAEVTTGLGAIGAGFSTQRLFPTALADSLADPDLEEAAIRFANGDDTGAEEVLLSALQGRDLEPVRVEAWMAALFDLYRATGQQARFETVALDFADRFGRSAPAWFSTPDLIRRGQDASATHTNAPVAAASEPVWTAPARLTAQALTQLRTAIAQGSPPWLLDWRALEAIDPAILSELNALLTYWCDTPAVLVFQGSESLEHSLRPLTPAGDASVDPLAWQVRMNALRVMHLQDEFDLVALDYCVTYEVSPPAWQKARCDCTLEGASSSHGRLAEAADPYDRESESGAVDGVESQTGADDPQVRAEVPALVELSGEILGDASGALSQLEVGMGQGATRLVISCANLVRVDFSAAGGILNWVTAQQARGCEIQLHQVNRIVAAFFNVIGINEYARVVPRST